MTDPLLDFVPADLMGPGEIGPVCGSLAALCGTFVLGLARIHLHRCTKFWNERLHER